MSAAEAVPEPVIMSPAEWRNHLDLVAGRMTGELAATRWLLTKQVASYLRAYVLMVEARRRDPRRAKAINQARVHLLAQPGCDQHWIDQWLGLLGIFGRRATDPRTLAEWLQIPPG